MAYILADGVRLSYLAWGPPTGFPVLLIHGITGCAVVWQEVARGLGAHGYHVITYDLRGHGSSDRSPDYSLQAHVRDAVAVIEQLALAPAHVVGHSLGGSIAWEVAAARPDLVARLVIEDQHPDADPNAWLGWQAWAAEWSARFASREEGLAFLRANERSLDWWEHSLTPLPDGGWGWAFDIPGVVETIRLKNQESSWERLAAVKAPTLLLHGEQSTHLNRPMAEQMGRTVPQCRVQTVPGEDHWVHRHPAPYVKTLVEFLTGPE